MYGLYGQPGPVRGEVGGGMPATIPMEELLAREAAEEEVAAAAAAAAASGARGGTFGGPAGVGEEEEDDDDDAENSDACRPSSSTEVPLDVLAKLLGGGVGGGLPVQFQRVPLAAGPHGRPPSPPAPGYVGMPLGAGRGPSIQEAIEAERRQRLLAERERRRAARERAAGGGGERLNLPPHALHATHPTHPDPYGEYQRRARTSPFRRFFDQPQHHDAPRAPIMHPSGPWAWQRVPMPPMPMTPEQEQYEPQIPTHDDACQTTLSGIQSGAANGTAKDVATQTTPDIDPIAHEERAHHALDAVQSSAQRVAAAWHSKAFVAMTDANATDVKHARLHYSEGLLQHVLRLDEVLANGNLNIRLRRKQLVTDIEQCVATLTKYAEMHDEHEGEVAG